MMNNSVRTCPVMPVIIAILHFPSVSATLRFVARCVRRLVESALGLVVQCPAVDMKGNSNESFHTMEPWREAVCIEQSKGQRIGHHDAKRKARTCGD